MYIECDNDNAVASSAMAFTVDASEKMRIDSSGRVLIGTATEGNADADALTISSTGGYTGITLRSDTLSEMIRLPVQSSDTFGWTWGK